VPSGPAGTRAWRRLNPDKEAARNDARRVPPRERICVECGAIFLGRPNRTTCSAGCRREHKRRIDGRRYHAAARQAFDEYRTRVEASNAELRDADRAWRARMARGPIR
jgi:hypothetical protein